MMVFSESIDAFLRRHPRLLLLLVILLALAAVIILLGGYRDVGLVYKAF